MESEWRANKSIVGERWKNCAAFSSSAPLDPREGPVIGFQLSEERDGQMTALDLPAGRHFEGSGGRSKVRREIFERLVHIHAHARDSDITSIACGSTFHQDAGNLATGHVDVVRRLD